LRTRPRAGGCVRSVLDSRRRKEQAVSATARLWLVALTPDSTVETALDFSALGEDRAAGAALLALSLSEARGFTAVAEDPDYPPA
jgi:hypothetical protein